MEKVNGEFHKHERSRGEDRIYKKKQKIKKEKLLVLLNSVFGI